jgi:hypothetical protein
MFETERDESGIDVYELFSAWAWKLMSQGEFAKGVAVYVGGALWDTAIELLDDVDKVIFDWNEGKIMNEQTNIMIENIHKKPELLRKLTPETKGRMLYDLMAVGLDWEERLDNLTDFNKRREEAALILVKEGIRSRTDWRETVEHIGEMRNSKLVPMITPGASPIEKAHRYQQNMAYLHSELLNDEEDWQALQDAIEGLPQ